ncbi:hypothetical protein Pint_15297 [Pistacia integerrima]|uniref:Uncharacterized protein n=1 Tax=Pistacia integerrima TaxID=434235 RepID=A0ACC0ZCI8_9ROSI|nr:hypothetical protein Pint_15297 [Pistacia integerrima]
MDGGDSPETPTDKDEDEALPVAESLSTIRLADAPILLLVYFHKALRAELSDLRRMAITALERASYDRELILELHRRFEFLKLVYKYHCATEDEVIFLALDVHIKNVASTYSLEHESIDALFDSVFDGLNGLLEGNEDMSQSFKEVVFHISTIRAFICEHMLKEEEQVFPLLIQEFSSKEQASLACEFLYTVPVILLEVFFPWMISFLSQDEKENVKHCLKEIVPEETSVQEVIISWLDKHSQSYFLAYGKGVQKFHESEKMRSIPILLSSKRYCGESWHQKKAYGLQTNIGHNQLDGILLWHRAIRKDLEGILDKLRQIKHSNDFSDLDSIVFQLKFFVDVLIFYSTALENFCYPVSNELTACCLSPSKEQFQVESLQQLLNSYIQNGIPMCMYVEKLFCELETFVMEISKQFAFQETQVFTVCRQNCSLEMQQKLLYKTLHMMPFGLLKSVIIWFSAHLSEDESRFILHSINHGDSLVNESFAYLLNEWFRIGFSGKTSVENFGLELQKMFKSRCSFLSEQIKEAVLYSSLQPDMHPCKGVEQWQMKSISTIKESKYLSCSSSPDSLTTKKYETFYSGATSLQPFFPQTLRTLHPSLKFSVEKCCSSSNVNGPIPIDLMFFFHKAIKKDLEYLVFGSAQLAENALLLMDFQRRFHLIQFLYQIHSDAEDEVAFPALEAKGKLQNISHSYSIDHRLEAEHFRKISHILNKMLELQVPVSITDSNIQDQRMLKYQRLCIRLNDKCKSMHKLLLEHVHREETELWPLFRDCFSIEEQEKIIKCLLGRISAEKLQDMIPWLTAALTPEEQHTVMSLWLNSTKNTMFEEWIREWWEGYDIAKVAKEPSVPSSLTADPLEVISTYLSNEVFDIGKGENCCNKVTDFPEKSNDGTDVGEGDKKRCNEVVDVVDCVDKPGEIFPESQKSRNHESLLAMSQEKLEAVIRKVSRDSSLDPQKKSYIIQNLIMRCFCSEYNTVRIIGSRWITGQQITHSKISISSNGEEIPGQYPSYCDPVKLVFGCKHYKRNCKLMAPCCNQLYTCIRCHDEVADHSLDRKCITKMMCMKCLTVQPIGPACSTVSCKKLSMARYYCRICKLFEDEREIYHCPYCNLCRLGKGLGIDYFHCMNCNACMSRAISKHICRQRCFMDNCPICHEDIFSSNAPVKGLPCGHFMHSACFQDYTRIHYTCPICSKSLGDMQVYFRMLDALLAEEKIPQEYSGRTQAILCNDCEKRGAAPFHWLYHKCPSCGSYNTRLL